MACFLALSVRCGWADKGPLVVLRRNHDEVISGGRPQQLRANRTNDLVKGFLEVRPLIDLISHPTGPKLTRFALRQARYPTELSAPALESMLSSTVSVAVPGAAAEATRRLLNTHMVAVDANHTAPMPNLDRCFALLEEQNAARGRRVFGMS